MNKKSLFKRVFSLTCILYLLFILLTPIRFSFEILIVSIILSLLAVLVVEVLVQIITSIIDKNTNEKKPEC